MKLQDKLIKNYKDIINWEHFTEIANALSNIDIVNLDNELMHQAALYTYYSGLLAKTKADFDRSQHEVEVGIATISKSIRDSNLGSKMTVKVLEDEVNSNEEYKKLKINSIVKDERYNMMKSLVKGLEHKLAMLVQISANNRAESKIYETN